MRDARSNCCASLAADIAVYGVHEDQVDGLGRCRPGTHEGNMLEALDHIQARN